MREIEARFLEIDKPAFVKRLLSLGAVDKGEAMLEEVIIYDKDLKWRDDRMFMRIRKSGHKTKLTYKHHDNLEKGEATEIEFGIDDLDAAVALFESIGFVAYRRQEKKRHTLEWNGVTFDIDTWPKIPTYVELEGPSMDKIKETASVVGLDWSKVMMKDARYVIENVYNIPVGRMHWFTFDRFE